MFIIDFRNKKVSQYGFSVVNNNDVDIVHIYSHFVQYRDYLVYLKVESEDKSYVDEILIDSENISVEEGALLVKWTMGAISTQCKKIYIQLEFREGNEEDSKVAQTNIVSITLGDTIDTSEGAKHLYPQILKELQRQIDELKVGSVSDFDLDYTNDVLTITLFNEEGEAVSQLQATIPTSNKVDKIAGKGLSTNDFTDALKNKLDGIMAGAQVNVLEGVQVDGNDLPIDANKKVNIANKVTKTTDTNKVYGTDGSGNQTTMPVDNVEGKDGNIARRKQTSGQMSVPLTPVADDDATAKQYVDKFGKTIELSVDQQTYVLTATLKDAKGNVLASQQVDLPLESMVVSGSYDSATQSIILTLQNGSTITIPVAGLISGLVSQTDFDALALRVTTAEGNIITLGNTKVNYSDITISGGFVIAITKNGSTYPIAEVVNISATPVVVQSTSDLPAQNDGNLYVVLDNGYLYAWSNGWQQLYPYTSDLLTITEVTAGEVIYSYISDKAHSNRPIQVESAVRDGEGNIINDTYAKKVGYEPQLRVGTADNIYSDRTIDEPETACPPIVMGTTGGDAEIKNGIENFQYMEGKSKKFNQLFDTENVSSSLETNGVTFTLNSNNSVTIVGQATARATSMSFNNAHPIQLIGGHKYYGNSGSLFVALHDSEWKLAISGEQIVSCSSSSSYNMSSLFLDILNQTYPFPSEALNVTFYPQLIDLTAIYGAGNEPTSVEDFKKDYPLDYYAYNAGEILSAKVSKLISRGRQQWNEDWELGTINTSTGEEAGSNSTIRSSHIPVIAGEKYMLRKPTSITQLFIFFYDVNGNPVQYVEETGDNPSVYNLTALCGENLNYKFSVPAQAHTMRMRIEGITTYNHDITISVYFEDGEGYDQYYAYSAQEVTLPNIELRSIGDIKDIAYAQGGGKRRLGIVDLGTLNYAYDSDNERFNSSAITNIARGTRTVKLLCPIYQAMSNGEQFDVNWNMVIYGTTGGSVYIHNHSYTDATAFKTAMSGVYLIYELKTEQELTENEGWVEQVLVDNYGTLEFVTDPQQVPQVEQPYYIEYTIDLVEFLDSSYTRAGGDASNFALVEEVEQAKENVEEALKNGSLKPANSDLADNFTPYDEDSGAEQNIPFVNQGTGCGNGETSVDTGSVALMRKKEGNLVIDNQYVNITTYYDAWRGTTSQGGFVVASGNSITISQYNGISGSGGLQTLATPIPQGHKVLLIYNKTGGNTTGNADTLGLYHTSSGGGDTNAWINEIKLKNVTNGLHFDLITPQKTITDLWLFLYAPSSLASAMTIKVWTIDLTQMFGSNDNIPAYLLAHPEAFFNYYQGSLTYNVGTPIVSNATTLKTIGRNIWDEEWEQGAIATSDGSDRTSTNQIRSKYIRVLPNTDYYGYCDFLKNITTPPSLYGYVGIAYYDSNKNFIGLGDGNHVVFTTPSNCSYIRFWTASDYGGTYRNDITISLYYAGESGYDQYYPYKVLSEVNTGNEVLRSAGSVRDYKEPNGTIHRLVGRVDLGDLDWHSAGDSHTFFATISNAKAIGHNVKTFISAMYETIGEATWSLYTDKGDMKVGHEAGTTNFYFSNSNYSSPSDFKQAMTGVYLFYELAEEVIEEGTPFAENLDIDDFGSMMWEGEGFNGIPMGNEIFYPVDYKASLDTLINHCDGDMERIVLDTDLEASEQVRDTVDAQLKALIGGVLRNCLCVKASLDYNNTNVVDLSTLTWAWQSAQGRWYATAPSDIKGIASDSQLPNMLASKYSVKAYAPVPSNALCLTGGGLLMLYTSDGVNKPSGLLAYEKAQ